MNWQSIVQKNELSVAIVNLSAIEHNFRIEAEFYTKSNRTGTTLRGVDIIAISQYGTSKELNDKDIGFPVLRLNEFEQMFAGKPAKYCDLLDEKEFDALKLKRNDVLICRTNGNPKYVGKSAIVMEDTSYAFASYLFRIKTNEKISPATLVSYLNSSVGREEIEKYSIVSNQANFSPAKFREISIPAFPKSIQNIVDELISKSWSLKVLSDTKYYDAEQLLLTDLNLVGYVPTNANTSTRNLSDCIVDDRFDAEYWQPKYDEIQQRVANIPQSKLGQLVNHKKGIEVGSEAYQDEGKNFIRVSDFSTFGVDDVEKKISDELYESLKKSYEPKTGEVLFTKDGTIGLSFALNEDIEGILSGAFLRLQPKVDLNTNYLALVLNSPYCKAQIERMSGGAIIAHLKPESAMQISIPVLSKERQLELGEMVIKSLEMRKEAKNLLEKAKRAVEIFVEQDEAQALAYLAS